MCESTTRMEIISFIGELYRKSKRSRLYRLIDPRYEGRKFVNYAMDGVKIMGERVDRKMKEFLILFEAFMGEVTSVVYYNVVKVWWEVTEDLHRVRPEAGYHYYVMMR